MLHTELPNDVSPPKVVHRHPQGPTNSLNFSSNPLPAQQFGTTAAHQTHAEKAWEYWEKTVKADNAEKAHSSPTGRHRKGGLHALDSTADGDTGSFGGQHGAGHNSTMESGRTNVTNAATDHGSPIAKTPGKQHAAETISPTLSSASLPVDRSED
jgi:hypothetical protein